jgi:hypothetical protein
MSGVAIRARPDVARMMPPAALSDQCVKPGQKSSGMGGALGSVALL